MNYGLILTASEAKTLAWIADRYISAEVLWAQATGRPIAEVQSMGLAS